MTLAASAMIKESAVYVMFFLGGCLGLAFIIQSRSHGCHMEVQNMFCMHEVYHVDILYYFSVFFSLFVYMFFSLYSAKITESRAGLF